MLLKSLYRKHAGDIYVLGSGPSLNFISPKFLQDKIVVCTNHTIDFVKEAKHLYLVAKEPSEKLQDTANSKNATIVTCEYHSANKVKKNYIKYPDITTLFVPNNDSPYDSNQNECLIATASTISTSLHFAAFLGASTILLIGHDCGKLDEKLHIDGYDKSTAVTPTKLYDQWMSINNVEYMTRKLKMILGSNWGIEVYSVNPFINFNLEGHKYTRFN